VMLALECGTFEVSTALAGLLGEEQLAAHAAMLAVITFTFVSFPFAVAVACTIR
jgi:multidrug resistance protein, MATE family